MKNNQILKTTYYVVQNADFVKINNSKISEFTKNFKKHKEHFWLFDLPFDFNDLDDEKKLMLMAVFNATSFSYWGNPYWNVEYKGNKYTRGSWSLIACIFRSIEEGRDILDPKLLSTLSKGDLAIILRGNTEIPLLSERVEILRELGSVTLRKYDGKLSGLIKESKGDAMILLNLILNLFPSFQDYEYYKSKKIYFQKKAQALVGGIYLIFEGKGYGNLKNIFSLTALADYIIPNLLREIGILEYSKALIEKIDNQIILEKGSPAEVEIRAHTIWAIELIRRELESQNIKVSALNINDYLWTIGSKVKTPFHLTRTKAY